MILTRRGFLQLSSVLAAGGAGLGGYAFAVEPLMRLRVQRYRLVPPGWTPGLSLKIAVLADIHACEPWMSAARVRAIADAAMALEPDLIVLLGDYDTRHRFTLGRVEAHDWAGALASLAAPLGVHAVLGNHDWWHDATAQIARAGPVYGRVALEAAGIPVYENDVVRLEKDGQPFWLAGLGDQIAFLPDPDWPAPMVGVDDLAGTIAKVTDDAPVILLAHEPDIFPQVPGRVSITLAGHTHGGQVRLFGFAPVVPSRYGNRYAYGHIVERLPGAPGERHLIVSGGLGCSILPVRFGVPPEIVLVELGA